MDQEIYDYLDEVYNSNNKLEKNAYIFPSSLMSSYSLGTEFILKWFFDKVDKSLFKNIFLSDKDAIEEFRNYDKNRSKVIEKPSLAIETKLDTDYLSDPLLSPDGGMDIFAKRLREGNVFFRNPEKHISIAMASHTFRTHYTFKIRLSTKMQQVEWAHYIRQALRIGETQKVPVDMDFYIPNKLMKIVAKDLGYLDEEGEYTDTIGLLAALNQYSIFPITCKLQTATQTMNFFMRVSGIYIHLNCLDQLSLDDGERKDMTVSSFIIDFTVIMTSSTPRIFAYYTTEEFESELEKYKEDENEKLIGIHNLVFPKIPEMNCKGWVNFMSSDYLLDESEQKEDDEYIYIEFFELIKDTKIEEVYNITKKIHISPEKYLDFLAHANGDILDIEMDWSTLIGRIKKKYLHKIGIVLYVDKTFVNEYLLSIYDKYGNRLDFHDESKDRK